MQHGSILITGSAGLIGRRLVELLKGSTWQTRGIDLLEDEQEGRFDLCDEERFASLLPGVVGIVHLAAVSRVVHAERDPGRCRRVNVDATNGIIRRASKASQPPWIIFASSREVYGQQAQLPVAESAMPLPMNHYARSKLFAEQALLSSGLRGAILRFSNVYGDVVDHADRVVPAFCAAAATGGVLRIDGADNGFDFTHVDDVAEGICRMIDYVERSPSMVPPVHFVSGRLCSLGQLAELAIAAAGTNCSVNYAPARTFDVQRFVGDPTRAKALISWRVTVGLEAGVRRLVAAHKERSETIAKPSLRSSQSIS